MAVAVGVGIGVGVGTSTPIAVRFGASVLHVGPLTSVPPLLPLESVAVVPEPSLNFQ